MYHLGCSAARSRRPRPADRRTASSRPRGLGRAGSTIVEVLVAIMVLTVGLLGLVTTAGLVTGMIGQGQRYTEAATLAGERIEVLRAERCRSARDGSEARGAFTVSWRIREIAGGRGRQFAVTVTGPTGRGARAASFTTTEFCP
jgi:Tfp pilus assembly protein PilV